MNTAARMNAIATTGPETSSIAWMVASRGLMPWSMLCCTASTTTIASSTTMPIARTRPNMLVMLIEKPSSGNSANVPTIDTGTVSSGISVARQFCRNRNTTRMTSASASNSVTTTSLIAARTNLRGVVRRRGSRCPPGKSASPPRGTRARAAPVSTALAPGVRKTMTTPAGFSFDAAEALVVLRAELDARHVANAQQRAIGLRAHDDVVELLRLDQAAGGVDRILEVRARRRSAAGRSSPPGSAGSAPGSRC